MFLGLRLWELCQCDISFVIGRMLMKRVTNIRYANGENYNGCQGQRSKFKVITTLLSNHC